MNKLTLLFGVLLCIVAVNARYFGELNDNEKSENEEESLRSRNYNSQPRHRKRRWQSSYGYDYPPPSHQYPERRDYDRNTQELQYIARLLEEISSYIRRAQPPPPPPPQPIYIPYPMFFNFPQISSTSCNAQNSTNGNLPTPDKRINIKDMDPNQNWGLVVSSESDYDDGSDGSRPISFDPIKPKQFMKKPPPKVDHGSIQGSVQQAAAQAPRFQERVSSVPGMCNAAILSCCGMSNDKSQQGQCFNSIGCSASFADGDACSSKSIQRALQSFQTAYSPVQ